MIDKTITTYSRPLSPHLQVYRPQWSSIVSIFHRITGVALVVGTTLLVAWLWSAAYQPHCFNAIHHFFSGIFGKILLIGWSWAFYFHFCNGIRHLVWDMGKGFELYVARRSAWAVGIGSLFFTVMTWYTIFFMVGGAE
jgi:succinate dehydrogenase / fumarate reductase cytochrome b subunit